MHRLIGMCFLDASRFRENCLCVGVTCGDPTPPWQGVKLFVWPPCWLASDSTIKRCLRSATDPLHSDGHFHQARLPASRGWQVEDHRIPVLSRYILPGVLVNPAATRRSTKPPANEVGGPVLLEHPPDGRDARLAWTVTTADHGRRSSTRRPGSVGTASDGGSARVRLQPSGFPLWRHAIG